MKTPGVYIVEKNAFPNSVVEVATAVPAFIGYTERADNKGKSLKNKPWRISSMAEFHQYFGADYTPKFDLKAVVEADETPESGNGQNSASEGKKPAEPTFMYKGTGYHLKQTGLKYLLYYSMKLFFQNGGGPCYIVSVGGYSDTIALGDLQAGIKTLVKEQEPTILVIPDAMSIKEAKNCYTLQQSMLSQCGKLKSRVAILDIWEGFRDRQDPEGDRVADFRNKLGINNLDYAAAYYPWLDTTIVQDRDLSFENIGNISNFQKLITKDLGLPEPTEQEGDQGENASAENGGSESSNEAEESPEEKAKNLKIKEQQGFVADMNKKWKENDESVIIASKALANKSLSQMSGLYATTMVEIKNILNILPPSAAMAGIYTMVDNSRGVWKAPANVSLNAVSAPAVNISHDEQEDLNVTPQGKSINAIRSFIGEGTLVWGARTLDGNSLDWRYINVRRTMIMLEESIRLAAKAYVFEANDANTWVTIKSMIRNFLTGIWKRGGLAGASPEDAFSVHVGLGETMTPEDILEGILRVTVLVAVTRPAEFIEITFQQQMQKS